MSEQLASLLNHWTGDTDFMEFSNYSLTRIDILTDALKKIYAPNFPASVGYHTLEMFRDMLENPSQIDCRIIVAGSHLRDSAATPILKGICISFYYKESDTAQLTYLAVDPAFRTEGLGNALFKQYEQTLLDCARDNDSALKGHYISCQNPEKKLKESHEFYDTYNPQKRFRKYETWGGRHIPFDYSVAYYLGNELQMDNDYALLAFKNPLDASYPKPETTIAFMRSLWTSGGISAPDQNPEFQTMIAPLERQRREYSRRFEPKNP